MSCPICFSESGKWSDDPIKCTPSLSTEEFKGFTVIKPTHIIEIQNSCNLAEAEVGLPLTTWTVVNNINLFQVLKTCIKELRLSIEGILFALDSDKDHYFNYDKDGNYMGTSQMEWHDPDLNSTIIQVKAIHIEDLRHPIPVTKSDLIVTDIVITDLGIVDGKGTYDIAYTVKNIGGKISEDCSGSLSDEILTATIIVHALNPEGKEIGSLPGFSNSVELFDNNLSVGYADGITIHTITAGHRTIKVVFNGIEMTQEIDIDSDETQELTFEFIRISFNLYGSVYTYLTAPPSSVNAKLYNQSPSGVSFTKWYLQTLFPNPNVQYNFGIWWNISWGGGYFHTYAPVALFNTTQHPITSPIGGVEGTVFPPGYVPKLYPSDGIVKFSSIPYAQEDM